MQRRYLFLQGPHGPFFGQLARRLARMGAEVSRVGFSAGDRAFWPRALPYRAFRGDLADWPKACADILEDSRATDLVLYGDSRAIHAEAIRAARARGLRLHVFEEGYLRPYWITYERGGANGNSRLLAITADQIDAALGAKGETRPPNTPAHWGNMRGHIVYGALYHFCVLCFNGRYRRLTPHRGMPVAREAWLYVKLVALMLPLWLGRALATRRVLRSGHPLHVVLLQLAHDASFRDHGPFDTMRDFLDVVIAGFAQGAPRHHHLVFKTHPLEDGRVPLRSEIRALARAHGVADRVRILRGGKLARLLDAASSVVTVNSTAAHQALWRGLPVKAFGRAVYGQRGFTSDQPLAAFFARPMPGDTAGYLRFRQFLLMTSQIPGSYYSEIGRLRLQRRIIDLMHSETDPYATAERGNLATGWRLFAIQNKPR